MKKILIAILLVLATHFTEAQTIDTTKTKSTPTPTGQIWTDKSGKQYPVQVGSKGGLYVIVTSRTGTTYKKYLPKTQ